MGPPSCNPDRRDGGAGSTVQSVLMLLKASAIAAMVVVGILWGGGTVRALPLLDRPISSGLGHAIGAAMIPVAFAYGGWQTASFVAGEMRDPRRDLSRGLVIGVVGVIVLYLAVNFVCLRVLGPDGLATTRTPASAVMRAAVGVRGARWIAFGIAISTLGFLSQGILTAPRVYYAMARDGLFFKSVSWMLNNELRCKVNSACQMSSASGGCIRHYVAPPFWSESRQQIDDALDCSTGA